MFRTMILNRFVLFIGFCLAFFSSSGQSSFTYLSPEKTNIHFQNRLTETETFNFYHFDYFYNGAGVAIGDINNDGLQDIYFTSNQEEDKLYLNQGDFNFKDITDKARVTNNEGWHSGVTMADINGDGLLDIYICRTGSADETGPFTNLCYINQGDNTFEEKGKELGLDFGGRSTQAAFFDADRDGDLDVFIINHLKNISFLTENTDYKQESARFLENIDGKFQDRSLKAGIVKDAYSLGIIVSDFNNDNWPDVYICNDFNTADFLYINQKNGTFKNEIKSKTGHVSTFSMGVDAADFNNDLLPDFYTLDMESQDHARSKRNMSGMNTEVFWNNINRGEHYQYMFNALQLNSTSGRFRDIAQMAGVAKTDWSWAPLIADFDNDGWKDLYVTNGTYRDVRNSDYLSRFRAKYETTRSGFNFQDELDLIPQEKLSNFMYRNNGDLTFTEFQRTWNIDQEVNSNGAAYADLDNDGDLDLVTNNINDFASILRNNTFENNYVQVSLEQDNANPFAIGAKVILHTVKGAQIQEVQTTRGYLSAVPSLIHFGLEKTDSIQTLEIIWPNGDQTYHKDVYRNFNNKIKYVTPITSGIALDPMPFLNKQDFPFYTHIENEFNDFEREILMPHKMSNLGPSIIKGDVDGDGKEDIYIGGAKGQLGQLFVQTYGSFKPTSTEPWIQDADLEDLGGTFFDYDLDGDLDLYVVSGGNDTESTQDRIYLNNGKGHFSKMEFDGSNESGKVVIAHDYDGDNDLDLFIPGRQVAGRYPESPRSIILENKKGKFKDVTERVAPEFQNIGMVTDMQFLDFDLDGDQDFVLVGEWMPITLFLNNEGVFALDTTQKIIQNSQGWWNCIEPFDIDQDGQLEYLVGNIGLNNKFNVNTEHPLHIYAHDFDSTGTLDIVLANTQDDTFYPTRGRQCSSEQMPFVAKKFESYTAFSEATMDDIYPKQKLDDALHLVAYEFRSGYVKIENGQFVFYPFENEMQLGPINGFAILDLNNDGIEDIISAGNKFETEVETARYDSNIGSVLLSKNGSYDLIDSKLSGFVEFGNVKDIIRVNEYIIVAVNNGAMQYYKLRK